MGEGSALWSGAGSGLWRSAVGVQHRWLVAAVHRQSPPSRRHGVHEHRLRVDPSLPPEGVSALVVVFFSSRGCNWEAVLVVIFVHQDLLNQYNRHDSLSSRLRFVIFASHFL